MRRLAAILSLTALALVMAPSAAAGGGCHWETATPNEDRSSASEVTAHIAGCRYEPTTLYIEEGTTVTWLNKDPVPHSVTGPFLTLGSDKLLNQGQSTSVTFEDTGVYPYYCVLHYGMAASVVVGDPIDGDTDAEAMPVAGGKYDPPSGPAAETTDAFPVAAAAGGIAIVAIVAGAAILVRKRRRALPVPGALP